MRSQPDISLEFFPPKSAAAQDQLGETARALSRLSPNYISVTYGAGGSTREGTRTTVAQMQGIFKDVAPHVSCIGATEDEMASLLAGYQAQGIKRLVALRGDLPSGYGQGGAFGHAVDLVRFIRSGFGSAFTVEVAAYPEGHPQARSLQDDLTHFVQKVQAGADGAITQYFFNTDAYFRFVDDVYAQGIDLPIIPGIMPITNYSQLARFSDACGTEIPRWIRGRLQGFGDDTASIKAFGLEVVTDLVDQLITAGVPGLHFYTMNRSEQVLTIAENLGIKGKGSLEASPATVG
jgi:methylenetetrahydrofolate reductase (NADPH)